MQSFVKRATAYAVRVVLGEIPACIEQRAACQNFLSLSDEYYIDDERATAPCEFIEGLHHVKGKWGKARQRFLLADWQIFIVVNMFGVITTATGKRRFRRSYIKVPRKNGKSPFMAGIGLYMLCADGEEGAEVLCGAASQKQAWEVFKPARQMVSKNADLREYFGVEALASNIHVAETGSKFEPVIGKPGDGASPSCAIVDEFHEHLTSDQYDTFDTGQGAREEPILPVITTAGDNIGGPCYDLEDEARKVVMGLIDEPDLFVMIFGIDPGDPWDTEEALRKANPNFDVSVSRDYLLSKLNTAKQRSAQQGIYKTKHLNVWVGARDAYFDLESWIAAGDISLKIEDFIGRPCRIALDLASKNDVAAMEITFPPIDDDPMWTHFSKFYIPEAKANDPAFKDYRAWVDAGWMTATPGNVIDFDFIEDDLDALCKMLDVVDVAFDAYQATWFSVKMMAKGVNMVEYQQGTLAMSEPMKEVDGNIRDGKVRHDGNPVMTWMIGNVVAKPDRRENVLPTKNKVEQKIDGPVALIMTVGRCIADSETPPKSVYEDRGVLTF